MQRRSTEAQNQKRAERERMPALLRELGVSAVPPGLTARYYKDAIDYAHAQIQEFAMTIGGGVCGIAPSSILGGAALQLAASKAAFAAGDLIAGSKFADAHKVSITAAWDICAKQAVARRSAEASEPHDALMKALAGPKKEDA